MFRGRKIRQQVEYEARREQIRQVRETARRMAEARS